MYNNYCDRNWIRVSVSLTVIMGITWIIGVLVIEVDGLFVIAFIFTIFVAFQGLFIFVILVVLDEKVREELVKVWKAKVAKLKSSSEKSLPHKINSVSSVILKHSVWHLINLLHACRHLRRVTRCPTQTQQLKTQSLPVKSHMRRK